MPRRQSYETILIGKNILVREGISRILHAAHFRIVLSASSADELPSELQAPQLLFLIIHNGDSFDLALDQIHFVKAHYPDARIAVVSDHYRPDELVLAYRAGASGYFVNVNSCDAFIKSIELVTMGEAVFPPAFLSFALDGILEREAAPTLEREAAPTEEVEHGIVLAAEEQAAPHLSPREKAILSCLIEGNSNKSIARKIDIAEATVKVHVKAILRKIRVQNRTQAAIWGMNNGTPVHAANGHTLPSIIPLHAPTSSSQLRLRQAIKN
ncbi:response regulator transcription factor [Bradyrhizobium sp. SSUT18]|uniref:response regulator transcription factor n=1 Tax=Bradyrhizobium sp. SSUT18 TaxID=3040602 RepID=UPI00244B613A|nr:response regulator transcription factor [Bradyrhizobium sp. SSUT18]MDH2403159.1 response regulator transcription factor [Bradyrhizobium sp. SSUT18]